jgi:hypothetical protein
MGAAAAAVIIKRERDLVDHFRRVGATSPDTAKTPDEIGVDGPMTWFRLVDDAVIRSAGDGRFYLDALTWEALERRRKRVMMIAFIIAVLAVAFVIFTTMTARR